MDHQILLAIFLLAFTIIRIWIKKSKSNIKQEPNLPPGPWKLPLIGNMHLFIGTLPHRCLRDLAKKHGPVMHLQLDIGFAPYGDYWRQLRKICTLELLTAKRVQSFRAIREEEVSNFIASISPKAGSPINLRKLLRALTSNITARAAFGAKCKDQEALSQVVQEAVEIVGGFSLADAFPSIKLLQLLSGRSFQL
ncbi:Cytochrome P450 - like 10 [Theobroma cacao]|nr:Cytochrome P450 - like 10 [Theobroma cacao]